MSSLDSAESDVNAYKTQWKMGAVVNTQNESNQSTLWFNAEPYHVGAAALRLWHTAILRQALPHVKDVEIIISNKPLGHAPDSDDMNILVNSV